MPEYETDFLKDTLQAIQRAQSAALAEGIKIGRREGGKDAERYRWLRSSWLDSKRSQISSVQLLGIEYVFDDLDAEIDAQLSALSAERAGGETE